MKKRQSKGLAKRVLGILLSLVMVMTAVLGGIGTGLVWDGPEEVYAKEEGKKNEDQKQACDNVMGNIAPNNYTTVIEGGVYMGGTSYSSGGTSQYNELDQDPNDFAGPLPNGDTFVDSSKLNWDNPSGFIIDIRDDRFQWVGSTDKLTRQDANGNVVDIEDYYGTKPIDDPMYDPSDPNSVSRPLTGGNLGIYYVGELKAYLNKLNDEAKKDGYTNIIEPDPDHTTPNSKGEMYLYRITYLNAVTLPNGTRGNLVLTMTQVQIETSVEVSASHPYEVLKGTTKDIYEPGYEYTKALVMVQGANLFANRTDAIDDQGNYVNQRYSLVKTANEVRPIVEAANAELAAKDQLNENTWITDKYARNALGTLLDLDIEVVDAEGNPVEGTISYAAHDMDFESAQSIWGRSADVVNGNDGKNTYAEGITIVSGSKSYALIPEYNKKHSDAESENEGWVPSGPGEPALTHPLHVARVGSGSNADGIHFSSSMIANYRDSQGTFDDVLFNGSNKELTTYQGNTINVNNDTNVYYRWGGSTPNKMTADAKKLVYYRLKDKYGLTSYTEVTPDMVWETLGNGSWKTYRNDLNDTEVSFDTGFAVLLDARKSHLQWSGSRIMTASIDTTLFDSSIYTYVEPTHGTGGGIYIETYSPNAETKSCDTLMREGTLTMGRGSETTFTIVPEDGYRVGRILVGDTNYGLGTTATGLQNYKTYFIDGNDIKDENGTVLGSFSGDDITDLNAHEGLKAGVVELAGFSYDTTGAEQPTDAELKIVIERNADGTVDVTLPYVDNPMHVHADFGADYYFYKVWKDGEPAQLNMTVAPAGVYPTVVTIPVPTGKLNDDGTTITQDVKFKIGFNTFTAQNGTYENVVTGETIDLQGVEFGLTPNNTIEYVEVDGEGNETLAIRPNVIWEGNNFVHKVDGAVDAEYPIAMEKRVANWEGDDAQTFTVKGTETSYVTVLGADDTANTLSPGNIVWKIKYPSEGVDFGSYKWPELPVEHEPDEDNHNASNHHSRNYWFAIEEVPTWSTESYDSSAAKVPGSANSKYDGSNWYAATVADKPEGEKLLEEYKYSNAYLSVFEDGGEIVNVPSIIVRGKKTWEDDNNTYKNRKEIWLHLDATITSAGGDETIVKDFLPAQRVAPTASGDDLIKVWGGKTGYATGVSSVKAVATDKKVPSNAKKQTNGSYKVGSTTYWVDELKKIDIDGNTYEYSIRETLDRAGNQPVAKDDPDSGLIGYTAKDEADWAELSAEKAAGSTAFSGKDITQIQGQDIERYNGEVKNTLKKIDVDAEKIWDDNDDQDGYRSAVDLTLHAGGHEEEFTDSPTVSIAKDATGNALKAEWKNLPYAYNGKKIEYSVTEDIKANTDKYTSNIESVQDGRKNWKVTVTNTHIPETASISIFKKWDDADNQDGLRKEVKALLESKTESESQWVSVSDQDGNGITRATVKTEDGLIITWLNLPVKRGGKDITYKIEEDVAGLGNYTTAYEDQEFTLTDGENKEALITNSYTPEVTEVTVTKVWDDMDDHDGMRPDSVTVQFTTEYQKLKDETEEADKKVIVNDTEYVVKKSTDGVEYYVIDDKYYVADSDVQNFVVDPKDNREITGFSPADSDETVKENATESVEKVVTVEGTDYTVKVTTDGREYYVIETEGVAKYYTLDGEEITVEDFAPANTDETVMEDKEVEVDKTVDGNVVKVTADGTEYYQENGKYYDLDGNELTVFNPADDDEAVQIVVAKEEYEEYEETEDIVLSESNDWTYTISDLPVNSPVGQKITYSIDEKDVPEGYEKTVTSTEAGKYTITNKHEVTINPPVGEPEETEDYKGKPQTSPKIQFTPDPDTLGPGGTENKIERVTLVDEDGNEVDTVTVPGEGTYVLNDDGTITFTPEPDFVGKTSGVKVRGYDSNGLSADTTYTPTVKHKVKYVDPLNPEDEQVVDGPRDCNTPDASDDKTTYEDTPGEESKNHPGYRFDGWDEEEVDDPDHPGDKITVRTAKYTPMYNINYDPNGGTGTMEDDNYAADDPTMPNKRNTFTRDGYDFLYFYAYITDPETGEEVQLLDDDGNILVFFDAEDMQEYFKDMPGGTSIRMEAQWEKQKWVRYIDEDGNTVYMDKTYFGRNDDEPAGPETPTKPGYKFQGWNREEDEDGNITYIAYWVPEEYTIKYDANGGSGTMTDQHFTGEDKEAVSKDNEFTREGYAFDGFTAQRKDGSMITDDKGKPIIFRSPADFINFLKLQGDGGEVTLIAQWKKLPTVTYIDPATGRVIQKTLPFLDEDTEPAPPEDPKRDGYTFNGWDRVVDEEGNVTYLAKWKPIDEEPEEEERTYNVTYIDPATGRVIQKTITVKWGDPEPSAPKDPTRKGYTFAGWDRVVDENGNITYLAKWTPIPQNIKTGDNSNIWIWIGILAAAVVVAIVASVLRKKSKN